MINLGVGKNIKKVLAEKDMTVKELSDITKIPINTLYSITKRDSENVRMSTIQKIAKALEVPITDLVVMDLADLAKGMDATNNWIEYLAMRILIEAKASDELTEQANPLLVRIIRLALSRDEVVDTAFGLKNTLVHNDVTTAIKILENEIAELHRDGGANILEPKVVPFGNSTVTMYGKYENRGSGAIQPDQGGDEDGDNEKDDPQS